MPNAPNKSNTTLTVLNANAVADPFTQTVSRFQQMISRILLINLSGTVPNVCVPHPIVRTLSTSTPTGATSSIAFSQATLVDEIVRKMDALLDTKLQKIEQKMVNLVHQEMQEMKEETKEAIVREATSIVEKQSNLVLNGLKCPPQECRQKVIELLNKLSGIDANNKVKFVKQIPSKISPIHIIFTNDCLL